MHGLRQDVGYALRGLARNGGFAAIAILTIGVGIGANTTIFSWMRALLLNPLPGAAEPARVVDISASLYGHKLGAVFLNILAGLAMLMAALGLYGVMAYSVAQRAGELGIRMAVGATPRDILALVLRQGLGFALGGLAAGSLAAVALARVVASFLVQVSPADPAVYGCVALFTVTVALLSAAIPAWRALRVDPVEALRCQ